MTVGADTEAVTTTLETIRLIRDELGREHVPRRLERLLWAPAAPRAERGLPAHGDGRRADQRDHVDRRRVRRSPSARPTFCSATIPGARAGSPRIARARPPSKRRRPRRERAPAPARVDAPPRGRSDPQPRDGAAARAPALPARRRRGARTQRNAGLRRRELERDRDRLDLRRPRHLQEVQGPDRLRRCPRGSARPARLHAPASCATAGGSPVGRARAADLVVEVPPLQTRPKAALVGVGRHVILRPSVQKRHLVLEEPTLEDQRSDLQRVLDGIEDLEPSASIELLRTLGGTLRVGQLRRHRGGLRRGAGRPRARRHDRAALCHRLRSRHDHGGRRRCSISRRASPSRCARCSTASSPTAPT